MHIWVDADACPKAIKEILYRTAGRVPVSMTLVANRPFRIPISEYIRFTLVSDGLDVADHHILRKMRSGDLVITADIPLAAAVIEKGGAALNPRGRMYTEDNIGEQLSLRNFQTELRGAGVTTGGPDPFSLKDREQFANVLNEYLRRSMD
ncbi:YaiI/YqxD family protein [bacterium]|nr:YaiI/YqxD family protein [bacterium]